MAKAPGALSRLNLAAKLRDAKRADGSKRFRDVNLKSAQGNDTRGTREITFTIEFNYLPV